jgi:hypothetical protein
VLISRATMKSQLRGNRMKKKSVKKKNLGGILEQLSPAYGIMKGKGPFSNIASQLGKLGPGLSPLGSLALSQRNKRKRKDAGMIPPTPVNKMAEGGELARLFLTPSKRKKSVDGIAQTGKTKGRREQKDIFKKTMGFKHGDTRSPSTKAVASRSSTPKTTKLADSGFINQGHQIKQLIRKLKGKKYKQYKDKAYKTLVKGT